jgi:hypothetical protein
MDVRVCSGGAPSPAWPREGGASAGVADEEPVDKEDSEGGDQAFGSIFWSEDLEDTSTEFRRRESSPGLPLAFGFRY